MVRVPVSLRQPGTGARLQYTMEFSPSATGRPPRRVPEGRVWVVCSAFLDDSGPIRLQGNSPMGAKVSREERDTWKTWIKPLACVEAPVARFVTIAAGGEYSNFRTRI